MADDDELDLDEFEDEDSDSDDTGSFDPAEQLRKERKRRKDAAKHHKKALEKATEKARVEAVEAYKAEQKRVASAKEVFGGFGYTGFAEDYLRLHDEVEEVKPDEAREWLEARGLQIQKQQEQPQPLTHSSPQQQPQAPQPSPAANFHQGGGTPTQAGNMSQQEFKALLVENPAEARKAVREGRVDITAPTPDWWKPTPKTS